MMILHAFLPRRACLATGAAALALLLGGCFDSGSDDADDVATEVPVEVPIVTPPSAPVTSPGDACDCAVPATDKQRSCAP
ncbi:MULTISPECIES: hypothetical protein [unclassified Achromobacter]|uniref:hypothetical protein n=1 Tax=unclassified Achromobacter TaxID=2626865 RepID=UPI000B516CD7|nr:MULTISPECIES: hypothetical protein [unclassified Achromobacter]OWT69032.1 hypothetical protein CEY05_27665 [Achromobacter sp. HZ34]OWT70437.1 hypothetical protein CEY04_26495 [Achromobacter sp. HZ28]